MGAVYEAENTWIKRRVALKILRRDLVGDRDSLRRFMQEAQSTTQIDHPNIVYVMDMGSDPSDGSVFIVQELLNGTDLRRYVESRGRLPVNETLTIVLPV